ncbi:MAG: hypothetical protein HKN50_07370 [Gammaproteobacteria bacterium]|nr:hypothetical protein [Gammaproteobacteria bacterium]
MFSRTSGTHALHEVDGKYHLPSSLTRSEIVHIALSLQFKNLQARPVMSNPTEVKQYFQTRLSDHSREIFSVMFLSTKHHLIDCVDMFVGTLDSAQVSIRDVVKASLQHNASAVIIAHNHPSGVDTPSEADKRLTHHMSEALTLFSINLLDHIIVGDGSVTSLAELGCVK